MAVKLIDTHYKSASKANVEEWLIDTDDELTDLPPAPAGSYAISAESGDVFFNRVSGYWSESDEA